MGWDYKNEEEAIKDMKKSIEIMGTQVTSEIEEVFQDNLDEDEEIDTNDIWYKIIKVDSDSFDALDKLEAEVNKFISNTTDTFSPFGPPQKLDDYYIQLLVDNDNLDNKQ